MAPKVFNQIKEDEIIFSDSATSQKLLDLLEPILSAIVETDSRLRYFACESLYNVTKVVRTQLIPGKQLENQPLGGAFRVSTPYFRSICTIVYFNIPAYIRF